MNPQLIVQDVTEIVTFPQAATRVIELLDDPDSNPKSIGDALSMDPALASKVLRYANSPLYPQRSPIDEISRAVMVLGTGLLRNIVFGAGAMKTFDDVRIEAVSTDEYWLHSISCGALAYAIAQHGRQTPPDLAFTAGLVHDFGQLALFLRCPDQMRVALTNAAEEGDCISMSDAEQEVLGFNHADVGRLIAEAWDFPDTLKCSLAYHHRPGETADHEELVACVHIANSCSLLMETDNDQLDAAPPVEPMAWERAGVEPSDVPDLIEVARERCKEMEQALL